MGSIGWPLCHCVIIQLLHRYVRTYVMCVLFTQLAEYTCITLYTKNFISRILFTYNIYMLNKSTLKVRGQSEAALQIGMCNQKL